MKIRNVQCSNQEKSGTVEGSLDNKQENLLWHKVEIIIIFLLLFLQLLHTVKGGWLWSKPNRKSPESVLAKSRPSLCSQQPIKL